MLALSLVAGLASWAVGFLGLPLAVPPEKEEPIMAYVAPEDCVLYATWASLATPSAANNNQTEQLLAEPEVQKLLAVVEKTITTAAAAAAKKGGAPPQQADQIIGTARLWIRTVLTKSGALFVSRLAPRGVDDVDFQGAVIIKAGDVSAQLDQSFTALLSRYEQKPTETTILGRPFRKLVLEGDKLEIVWGANNGYMMIGLGAGALEEMSARIRAGKEPSWLTQLKANLPVERRSTVSYVNIKKLLDTFGPLGGEQAGKVISALGLEQLGSLQAVSGLGDTGMLGRTLLAIDGQPRGLLTLLDEKGITAADLKHIPADCLAGLAWSFDVRKIYDKVLAIAAEIDPTAAEQMKAQAQQVAGVLGMSVPDALGAVGTKWSFYSAQGAGPLPSLALTIDVRDKQRLVELEKRLRTMLAGPNGEIPNVGRISQLQIAGQPAAKIALRAPQLALVTPTWCITDKQLIIANSPEVVEAVITGAAQSLADKPEVAARLTDPGAVQFLSYFDTPRSFAAGYAQVQMFLPVIKSLAEQNEIPLALEASDFPAVRTIAQHLRPSVTVLRRTAKGLESESHRTLPGPSVGASTGVLVALLLPAVQAAREAARRAASSNQIKQQMLALHNYVDAAGGPFPPAYTVSKDGRPLLSWRVAILPYLEQQALYKQFHLDEPWDSDHNKRLIEQMPRIFRSPNSRAKPGMTVYLGVGGEQGVLAKPTGAGAKGMAIRDIKDGTSNTIVIVEASDESAVEWTKPVEWVPDASNPLKGLLGMRPNGFLAGFADGHTAFVSKNVDPKMLGYLFKHSDGHQIDLPAEQPPGRPAAGPRPAPPVRAPK